MCIIIHRPRENDLQDDTLEACAKANKDGWGIMMLTELGLVRHRGLLFKDFMEVYSNIPRDVEMAIHFRIKTHGKIDIENCHPFSVLSHEEDGQDMFLMHNGIINIKTTNKDFSDTWHWVNGVLRPIMQAETNWLKHPAFRFMLDESVNNSRLLILDHEGNFTFINEDMWRTNDRKDGCRYSTHVPKNYAFASQNKQGGAGGVVNRYYGGIYGSYMQDNDGTEYGTPTRNDAGKITSETTVFTPAGTKGTDAKKEGGGTVISSSKFLDRRGEDGQLQLLSGTKTETSTEKTDTSDTTTSVKTEVNGSNAVRSFRPEDEEYAYRVDENLTPKQLNEMYVQSLMDQGILIDESCPLGLDFASWRTHLLETDPNACDEIEIMDEVVLQGATFKEIRDWVSKNEDEAALFIYRLFG